MWNLSRNTDMGVIGVLIKQVRACERITFHEPLMLFLCHATKQCPYYWYKLTF